MLNVIARFTYRHWVSWFIWVRNLASEQKSDQVRLQLASSMPSLSNLTKQLRICLVAQFAKQKPSTVAVKVRTQVVIYVF